MMKVLALTAYYLPGFKAGGPVRSVANLVETLGDEVDFRIITADRDLGDVTPYAGTCGSDWRPVGKAHVLYLPPTRRPTARLAVCARGCKPDLLYLNSFFNVRVCAGPLLLRDCGALPTSSVLIAPRGEFGVGAMAIRSLKKRAYIAALSKSGMLRNVWWHASSEMEREDIARVVGRDARVLVAPNLSDVTKAATSGRLHDKKPGELGLVYLGRISPKKNLLQSFELLSGLPERVRFDIWGPIEDGGYWQRCLRAIERLPENISVTYRGAIEPGSVRSTLATYDALLFPTLGENFGHVIIEALAAGCPVLISDRTPWRNLQSATAGWDLSLADAGGFRRTLTMLLHMKEAAHCRWREGARTYGERVANDPCAIESSRALFHIAVGPLGQTAAPNRRKAA
jgi:glycosyltransferase involved in cell wall biosynthesis